MRYAYTTTWSAIHTMDGIINAASARPARIPLPHPAHQEKNNTIQYKNDKR